MGSMVTLIIGKSKLSPNSLKNNLNFNFKRELNEQQKPEQYCSKRKEKRHKDKPASKH